MTLITLSSDFEKQSYGCGAMEGVIRQVNPDARVIHHMHGIEEFGVIRAAYAMETLIVMPVGFHVCVVDPGVGTKRRGIGIEVGRGDILIGPDNGLFIPACRLLGGIKRVHELSNPKYHRQPVSPIFHGRDIFAMAAAHLSAGVPLEDFGPKIPGAKLQPAPYEDATVEGGRIKATVIEINRFGTVTFNILQGDWEKFVPLGALVTLKEGNRSIRTTHVRTFGEVPVGKPCIMKDDFTRVEAAVNQGSLIKKFPVKIGERVVITNSRDF